MKKRILFCLIVITVLFSGCTQPTGQATLANTQDTREPLLSQPQPKENNSIDDNKVATVIDKSVPEETESEKQAKLLGQEIQEIKELLSKFKVDSSTGAEWFAQNNIGSETLDENNLKSNLGNCFKPAENNCFMLTACPSAYAETPLHWKYNESESSISSLEEVFNEKSANSEELALLSKAEYNYLKEKCQKEYGKNELILETWIPDKKRGQYVLSYYPTDLQYYYYTGIQPLYIDISYQYPAIVCRQYFSEIDACRIALTRKPIDTNEDIFVTLNNAPLIKLADGEFGGFINGDSGISLQKEKISENKAAYISTVITNSNYYIFDETKNGWVSYLDLKTKLTEKENQLKEMPK
ncbi:MAG TPA: hypothetical protein VI977_05135 [archaeon]|nr:hypothetical protein [archaeon]